MTTSTGLIVGVRFRKAGKIFYFDAVGHDLALGEYVVVETSRGLELGYVVIAPGQMLASDLAGAKPVLRLATDDDRRAQAGWRAKAHQALELARLRAGESGVSLMIVAAEYNLDGSTLTLSYESEEHVDYRTVVRDVSAELGVTVQMERIGPRDRAKLTDGYDRCGQRLCCASWLTAFPSVGIKMAKEQNLALNPAKISGVCGRLYCCLTFEYEVYRDLRGQLPKLNQRVSTPTGDAKVIAVHPLKESVTLLLEADHSRIEVTAQQLQYGMLVRPTGVTPGEPAIDEETKAAKTAVVPLAPRPLRPRRPSGQPGRQPQAQQAQPAQKPPSQDDAAPRRRRRRRGRRGGSAPGGEQPGSD